MQKKRKSMPKSRDEHVKKDQEEQSQRQATTDNVKQLQQADETDPQMSKDKDKNMDKR